MCTTILCIDSTAGLTSIYFMGTLGKRPRDEWVRDHVFSLLKMFGNNLSRSNSSNGVVQDSGRRALPRRQGVGFKLCQACWACEGAAILKTLGEGRLGGLFSSGRASFCCSLLKELSGHNQRKRSKTPYMRIEVTFAAVRVDKLIFLWANRWLRRKDDFLLKGEDGWIGRLGMKL